MYKILLVAGDLISSYSYEYNNFQKPLEKIGYNIISYDFINQLRELGRDKMNQNLLEIVKSEMPKVVIFVPRSDEFIPKIIDEIGQLAITLGYFFDDMWRIGYSHFWASHFNFVTTSDVFGIQKYKDIGITNVIYSPFGCNTDVYYKIITPKLYDISFVGGYNTHREWYIKYLKKAGFNVCVWGKGWPQGEVNHEQMINIFNQSRINLNLSNSICWDIRYVFTPFKPIINTFRIWKNLINVRNWNDVKNVEQVKARHFEINACGGFQLSYYVEGLERIYSIGDEITLFASPENLIEKVDYYLKHDEEREAIAQKGFVRTITNHSMEIRFKHILNQLGV